MPEIAGRWCCGATRKSDCETPPCPLNLECWSPEERRTIEAGQRAAREKMAKAAAASRPQETTDGSHHG